MNISFCICNQSIVQANVESIPIEFMERPSSTSLPLDMEGLAVEQENSSSDIYFSLGLKEKVKGNAGNPRVLSLVSSNLEKSVQRNEMSIEKTQSKDLITIFHGSRAPTLGIRKYIDRIFKYSCCSPSCFVLAQIYMDRFSQRYNVRLTSLTVHRLLFTSVMIAAKFIDDGFFNNAYYAKVGGLSTRELNRLEMKFLFGIGFRLHVSVSTFEKYCLRLENEVQVERGDPSMWGQTVNLCSSHNCKVIAK